ncbi:hypothetical protein NDU88_001388 [Pleurodeles waltl]|uniref:Uncharacterized protein n=1 Tax=Pleurodeles waltl TaxID=8319 RepID=A0AAV7NFL7_PLEWA|nr:hypothetical protein NDU88_001388 [Pleurodeles waltl]
MSVVYVDVRWRDYGGDPGRMGTSEETPGDRTDDRGTSSTEEFGRDHGESIGVDIHLDAGGPETNTPQTIRRTPEPSAEEHGPIEYSTGPRNRPSPVGWGPDVNPRVLNGLVELQQKRRDRSP